MSRTPIHTQEASCYYSDLKPSPRHMRDSLSKWTPFDFHEYLESREGKIWQHEDTVRILERAEQMEALIVQLMPARA